ncbi:MAG: division/cell wall cluster transcriptional repressor MraZ [Candidatus Sumerlaeota bacterium]
MANAQIQGVGFIGKHDLRIDDKGRLTMPARFKKVLADEFGDDEGQVIVRVNFDQKLTVEPQSVFAREIAKYDELDDLDEDVRRLKEMMTGLAEPETIDKGGRIRIKPGLREIADLGRDVTVIGRGRSFHIWNRADWESQQSDSLKDLKALTEKVRRKKRGEES